MTDDDLVNLPGVVGAALPAARAHVHSGPAGRACDLEQDLADDGRGWIAGVRHVVDNDAPAPRPGKTALRESLPSHLPAGGCHAVDEDVVRVAGTRAASVPAPAPVTPHGRGAAAPVVAAPDLLAAVALVVTAKLEAAAAHIVTPVNCAAVAHPVAAQHAMKAAADPSAVDCLGTSALLVTAGDD